MNLIITENKFVKIYLENPDEDPIGYWICSEIFVNEADRNLIKM